MDYINGRVTGIGSINDVIENVETLRLTKQDNLISGVNIKSIGGQSIMGSGNLDISGSILTSSLTTTIQLGGIPSGKTYEAGTSLETIIRDMLAPSAE